MNYEIHVLKSKLIEMASNATADSQNKSAKNIAPSAVLAFVELMKENESESIRLTQTHGQVYLKPTKSNTPYLRVNAYCNLCPKKSTKYTIKISKLSYETSANYIKTEIQRVGTHQHQARVRVSREKRESGSKKDGKTVARRRSRILNLEQLQDDYSESESSHHLSEERESELEVISDDEAPQKTCEHNKTIDLADSPPQYQLDRECSVRKEKSLRIVKDERSEFAKQILVDFGGSVRTFKLFNEGKGIKMPSEVALRKIVSEYVSSKYNIGSWIENVCAVQETSAFQFKCEIKI